MGISMATSHPCKTCGALVYKDEAVRRIGLRCGCLARYIMEPEKIKKDRQLALV